MEAPRLLMRLRGEGFDVSLEGARVCVSPASLLTDDLRKEIRSVRDELVETLRRSQGTNTDREGWERIRTLSIHLGRLVRSDGKVYQLWGISPRGGICFDGYVMRTFELDTIAPSG